jgi:hypothetical protein
MWPLLIVVVVYAAARGLGLTDIDLSPEGWILILLGFALDKSTDGVKDRLDEIRDLLRQR